jgi:hypothetical protein
VIALWLGHQNLNTTHQYMEADLAMKDRALKAVTPPKTPRQHHQQDNRTVGNSDSASWRKCKNTFARWSG